MSSTVEPSVVHRPPVPRRARLEGPEPPIPMGDTGRDLYAATEPVGFADSGLLDRHVPSTDWAWARFLSALSLFLDAVAEMVRDDVDGNPGWTHLASPVRCPDPWLRVLAQWAGIKRWDAMNSEDLRELIGPHAPGMWRGTRAAMLAAVRRFLPPAMHGQIYFEERADGNPYWLRVFTYTFAVEGPRRTWSQLRNSTWGAVADEYSDWFTLMGIAPYDVTGVWRALEAAKPAGLRLIYEVRSGQQWSMLRDRGHTWETVHRDYADWAAVHSDLPT